MISIDIRKNISCNAQKGEALNLGINIKECRIFQSISQIFHSKDQVKVAKLICEHPELSNEKVSYLTDMMKSA